MIESEITQVHNQRELLNNYDPALISIHLDSPLYKKTFERDIPYVCKHWKNGNSAPKYKHLWLSHHGHRVDNSKITTRNALPLLVNNVFILATT